MARMTKMTRMTNKKTDRLNIQDFLFSVRLLSLFFAAIAFLQFAYSVSYTHLDVYKRQTQGRRGRTPFPGRCWSATGC